MPQAVHYTGLGPPYYGRVAELLPVALKALQEGNLQPGERVVVYTDSKKSRDIVDAFIGALSILRADLSVVMTFPYRTSHEERSPMVVNQLKEATTLIDLPSTGWIYARGYSEILESGTRILTNMVDLDSCLHMAPIDETILRARRSQDLINRADSMRVSRDGSTDFTASISGRGGQGQTGTLPRDPGGWDNFPSAQAAAAPLEDSLEGTLVMRPGDIFATLKHVLKEPVTLTFRGGRIVDIQGGADAALLRDWLAAWEDPKSYIVSHLGWGCDHRAEVASNQLMEWESFGGNVMIAFGSNDGRFLGGTTHARSHLDVILFGCDFALDGAPVLRQGAFIRPELARPTEFPE
jgi:2,5-dihydroxypyridine 5,6-dioxygenase